MTNLFFKQHTHKNVANETIENIIIVIKVDCIDEKFHNVSHDCNLNFDLRFFGFDADAVDHDKITTVHNKLMMKLKLFYRA